MKNQLIKFQENNRLKYRLKLSEDRIIYGSSCEKFFKPKFFQKLYRRFMGLPIDRRRICPTTLRIQNK